MKRPTIPILIDIFIHAFIIISTTFAVCSYFLGYTDVFAIHGKEMFRFFTTDSNLLMALASAFFLVLDLGRLRDPGRKTPKWATLLRFSATAAVTLTLLTVVFFLGPTFMLKGYSYFHMFEGNLFFLHFFTPVLAIVSWIFFGGREPSLRFREALWGVVPTAVYSVVYIITVVTGTWEDFYGFTFGGKLYLIPAVLAVMYGVSFGIAAAERRLRELR